MTVVGVTGHQQLPRQAQDLVEHTLGLLLPPADAAEVEGASSLAAGADQLFADYLVRAGSRLRVVLPCADYVDTFDAPEDVERYRTLLALASTVEELPFDNPTEEAFFAAGRRIVDIADWVIAVWDGQPSRGMGGTADVVAYARGLGKRVEVVWPSGVQR